jgi:hypothetical protein
MVAVIGAIAVARGRQGIKSLSRSEQEIARSPAQVEPPSEHSGVFRHDIEAQPDPGHQAKESSG